MRKSLTIELIVIIPFVILMCTVFSSSHNLANGVVSAKYFWFYVSMGLMIPVAFIVSPIRRWFVVDGLFFLLGISIVVVALLSRSPFAKTKLILLVLLVLLYFLTRRLLSRYPAAESLFVFCLIATALAECVLGLRQLYGYAPSNHGLFKLTGTFFNPGPYSGYIGMIFPLSLHHVLQLSSKVAPLTTISGILQKPRVWVPFLLGVLSIFTVAASLLVLPAAMSRAAWVGVVVGSCFVLLMHEPVRIFFKRYIDTTRKKVLIALLFMLFISVSCVGVYALKPDSVQGRLLLWKQAVHTMVEHPFGVGLGKMGQALGATQAAYFAGDQATQTEINRADTPSFVFNEYLQIGVESGFLTVLLYLCMLSMSLRNAYKTKRYGISGAILSLSCFALFSYPFNVLPFLIVLVFLLAISNTIKEPQPVAGNCPIEIQGSPFIVRRLYRFIPSLLTVSLIIWCLIDRYPTYKAWRDWAGCKQLMSLELHGLVVDEMLPLYAALNDQPEFLFDYARSLSLSGSYQESNRVLQRSMSFSGDPMLYNIYGKNCQALHRYDQAEVAFKQAYNRMPNRLYPLFLLTKMYAEKGETNKAIETATLLFNHSVIVPSKAIEEMKDSLKHLLNINSFEQP